MDTFAAAFPDLAASLAASLRSEGLADLAADIETSELVSTSYDPDGDVCFLRIESVRELNAVETNIIGVRLGTSVPVSRHDGVSIALDNFGRVLGIEVISPNETLVAAMPRRNGA